MHLELGPNEMSSWNSYPDHYKHMGFEIMLSPDIGRNDRETYDLLSYLGDLGGLVEILKLIIGVFVLPFSEMRMSALMTNRLYHISQDNIEVVNEIKEANGNKPSNKLRERPNGDIELDVP